MYRSRCMCSKTSVFRELRESNMDKNIFKRPTYVSPFSFLPLSISLYLLLFFSVSLNVASTPYSETGIALYFPKGYWVNSRSQDRDHGAYKSKCMSAIFRADRELTARLELGARAASSSDVSQFPQSTRYERSPRKISLIEHISFTSQERNCLSR